MIRGDNPIKRSDDDVIGRASAANQFARNVLGLDASEGAVVGILGPWGSGKTSFINLAREEFEKERVPILDFNPWMFSGTAQLVQVFFVELSAQLKQCSSFANVAESLGKYGDAFAGMGWIPFVGTWFERIHILAKIASKISETQKDGVHAKRENLKSALKELDEPILVVLDDIDRLSSTEIRDIFKLVRLTANFPNIIYVVAFDRSRVEKALDEQGISGRDYLEKILQVSYDLPEIPSDILISQISSALQDALAEIGNDCNVDEQVWPDVLMDVIRPLIRNMRDIRRYAATIHGTVSSLNGKIALADLLALEAVRIFVPNVYTRLHGSIETLTGSHNIEDNTLIPRPESHYTKQVECLIEAAGDHGGVVKNLIQLIFPAAAKHVGGSSYGDEWRSEWLKARRVGHEYILRLYLERKRSEDLQDFDEAANMWKYMAQRDVFDDKLRSLHPARRKGVIASLELYEERFVPEYVVPGTIVLYNLLPLPELERNVFSFSPTETVNRVVCRLLNCLDNKPSIENAVRKILPELTLLSSKLELIDIVGCSEEGDKKLITEQTALEFEQAWREEVRSTAVADFANEYNLLKVLLRTKRDATPDECPLNIDDSPEMTLAVLRDAQSEVIGQYLGSRAIQSKPRLPWKELKYLYDDETTIRNRVQGLKAAGLEGSAEYITLAEKYLDGYRDEGSR